ncbi:MAG: DUF2341 domain-containing protein [Patescibacteria group bacterium]|nr:DUF2341 domain-containing protein [Patescibacteria group bacterium]
MKGKIAKLFQLRKTLRNQSSLRAVILGFAVLALIPVVFFILKNSDTAAAWFNDHWLYRKKVEITNTGSNQTDFQISFTMDTAALITAGKMQADCDDIRVTDINGKVIPHWIEENNPGCNNAATKIWVKVSSIETSGATIYAYYGNPSVSSVENGNNVFEFFDDFNKSALDSIK